MPSEYIADILSETTLSLAQAAKRLPPYREGRPVSVSCLTRWVQKGVKTPSGIVRLEAVHVGGRWVTSAEALKRFAEAQTAHINVQPSHLRSPSARRHASVSAGAELAQASW